MKEDCFFRRIGKASSRLNVSLGVRHDYFGAVSERDGLLSSLVWGDGDNLIRERLANASVKRVNQLYSPQKLNISAQNRCHIRSVRQRHDSAPRGTSAWRINRIMASRSVAHAPIRPTLCRASFNPQMGSERRFSNGIPPPYNPEFGRGLNDHGGVVSRPGEPAIRISPWVVNPTIKTQYSESWFFNVQREVAKGWIAEIGYFGDARRKS